MKALKKAIALALAFCMLVQPLSVAAATATKLSNGTTTSNPFPKGTADSNSFRIPSLVTLSDGTLVAAADARWNTTYDGGGLDTIVSRSTDNGANWSYSFANYLGDNGNEYNGSSSTCFIDPAMAVTSNDTIYMLVDLYPYGIALNGYGNTAPSTAKGFDNNGRLLLSNNNHSSYGYYLENGKIYSSNGTEQTGYTVDSHFNITGNGVNSNLFFADSPFKVVRTGFLYLTKSTDKGETWSAPTLLNLKTTSEQVCLVGPGRGLVTKGGMIVFPCYSYNGSDSSQRTSFIYSTDNGSTWERSSSTGINWSSESAVVELTDGTLRFFYRNGTSNLCYVDYSVTSNTWETAVNTGIATNSNCQISAITYSKTVDGKQVLLVSCPTGPNSAGSNQSGATYRQNGKIFVGLVNTDKTISWQTEKAISVESKNSSNSFMYSCLTELKDGKIALLYEDNESSWGTGDNSYYQMFYATYDFPMTADASGSGDSSDENSPVTKNTENVVLEIGEEKEFIEKSGNYSSATVEPNSSVAAIELEGKTVAGGTTVGDAVTSLVNGTAYYIKNGNNYLTSSATWTDDVTKAATWTWDSNNRRLYIDGKYLVYYSGSLSTTTNSWSATKWTVNSGSFTYSYYSSGWKTFALGSSYSVVDTEAENSTIVTITGVKPGTTAAVVGETTYNITVNKKVDSASVAVGHTATFNNAGTKIESNTNKNVATATITNGVLTVKAVAVGTTVITTDYGVYTITVNDGTPITIKEKDSAVLELDVELEEGQYVVWETADSSFVSVANKYNSDGSETNSGTIIGNAITDSPIVVTGTIYNENGTVVSGSTKKWVVTVEAGSGYSNQGDGTSKYIYVDIVRIQNCTVYYAVNGGELIQITDDMLVGPYTDSNGTYYKLRVPLMDEQYTGGIQISFFADPDEGYALTYMSSTNSAGQYYCLSNGNKDGVGSSAWPFKDGYNYDAFDALSTKPAGGDTSVFDTSVGVRWGLVERNFTVEQLKMMYTNAIAKGCDGVLVFTKNNNGKANASTTNYNDNDLVTNLQFIAQKLPDVQKEIASIKRDGKTIAYDKNTLLKIGDTINYTIKVIVLDAISTFGNITYSNVKLNDPLTKDNWTGFSSSSTKGQYKFVDPEGNEVTLNATYYTYSTDLTLTTQNFTEVVKDGVVTNTADLSYDYKSQYSIGTLKASASAVAEITVDIPSYVVDFGLPVTFDLTELALVSGNIKGASATYGKVDVSGNVITYTPKTTLKDVDYIELELTDGHYAIAVYPATTVYYEEGFAEGSTGDWTTFSKTTALKQTAEEVGNKTNVYGYDSAYNPENGAIGASNGTSASSDQASIGKFTFTGTGVDIYTNNTKDSGVLMAWVKNSAGNTVKAIQVDTHMANGSGSYFTTGQDVNAYNVPVVSLTGLERDTYTVELRHIGQSVKTENADGTTTSSVVYKPVSLDGYRVHGTIDYETAAYVTDLEDKPAFVELRNKVLAGLNVKTDTENTIYAEDIAADTLAQVYATAESTEGAVVLSSYNGNSATAGSADVQDLLNNGPKNELYLRPGDSVVFKVTTNRVTQIGLKALDKNVTNLSIKAGDTTISGAPTSLSTSTDMFYKLADQKTTDTTTDTTTYTITNNAGGILAVTELKICDDPNVTFEALTEEDLVPALESLGFESEKVEPEYADATLNIALNDATGNALATTALTANGIVGEANTFSAAAIEEAVAALVPEGYELKDAAYADQEVAYGEEATVTFTAEEIPEDVEEESESIVVTVIKTIASTVKNIYNKLFGWL